VDLARRLADALIVNATLTPLCLENNNILDEGAAAVFYALSQYNATLTWLDLTDDANISTPLLSSMDDIVPKIERGCALETLPSSLFGCLPRDLRKPTYHCKQEWTSLLKLCTGCQSW
jgi:hypothetical protein